MAVSLCMLVARQMSAADGVGGVLWQRVALICLACLLSMLGVSAMRMHDKHSHSIC